MTQPQPPIHRRALRRLGLFLAAAAFVAACTPAPTPTITLDLDDPSVTAIRGQTIQVNVELTRDGGADAPVALTITGLPTNVTATFAPASLTGTTTESTLTLTIGATATDSTTNLTVTGTAGTLTTDTELTLDITSLTINGRLEGALNRPLPSATVTSQGETTFSDATGAFTLSGLSLPYDLVISSPFDDGALHVYEGLTSATPLLRPAFAAAFAFGGFSADVQGSFVGGALGADEAVRVCVEGIAVTAYGCADVGGGATDYAMSPFWFDGLNAAVRIHALHMEVDVDGNPTAYLGYETMLLNLTDGGVVVADLDFDPVASGTLTGTTSQPATLTESSLQVTVRFGPNLSMPVSVLEDAATASFAVLVPVAPGISYDVVLIASEAGATVISWKTDVGLDAGSLAIAAPAQLDAPTDGAMDVDLTTPFVTTDVGAARTYLWQPDFVGPFIALTTTRSSVTIPDPDLAGIALPAGADYVWRIIGHGDESVDTAAAGGLADQLGLFFSLFGLGGPGPDGDRTFADLGEDRFFTLVP